VDAHWSTLIVTFDITILGIDLNYQNEGWQVRSLSTSSLNFEKNSKIEKIVANATSMCYESK